jgi:hypothetical protein
LSLRTTSKEQFRYDHKQCEGYDEYVWSDRDNSDPAIPASIQHNLDYRLGGDVVVPIGLEKNLNTVTFGVRYINREDGHAIRNRYKIPKITAH